MTPKVATPTSTNEMWDRVKRHVKPSQDPWSSGAPMVGDLTSTTAWTLRTELSTRYAWTVTSPDTVAFVAEHARGRLIDPMAGTGWWAYLLRAAGVDVYASDIAPAGTKNEHVDATNRWVRVTVADAATSVAENGAGRSLLLSWPPYDEPVGVDTVRAFPGDRVIFIGEGEGGCTGDDDLFAEFQANWVEVAVHRPVQFWGIHDYVTVYDRR